jgi:hypothetical protein
MNDSPEEIRPLLKGLAEAASVWTPAARPWSQPLSLDVPDLPEFPTDVLPEPLRGWVEAESHATQTLADFAALLALAVCSVVIARRMVEFTMRRASRPYDPLSCIPQSTTIRQRLADMERIVRRLRILLRTAERFERAGDGGKHFGITSREASNVG